MKLICIVGAGGFGKEILQLIRTLGLEIGFFVDDFADTDTPVCGLPVKRFKNLDPDKHAVVIAIGDPHTREKIVKQLPAGIETPTLIHPTAILGDNVRLGRGSVICAYSVLTVDIELGAFAQININCTIGHDTKTGKFFTSSPGVSISGKTVVGDYGRFGPNSSTVEKVTLGDDIFVGAGAVVTKNLQQPGVYLGAPARWKRDLR